MARVDVLKDFPRTGKIDHRGAVGQDDGHRYRPGRRRLDPLRHDTAQPEDETSRREQHGRHDETREPDDFEHVELPVDEPTRAYRTLLSNVKR